MKSERSSGYFRRGDLYFTKAKAGEMPEKLTGYPVEKEKNRKKNFVDWMAMPFAKVDA